MGNRKGIIDEALERLDSHMAIGEKRSKAKAAALVAGELTGGFSTGKIHSYQTRTNYQKIVMSFIQWARREYGINRLNQLDERADELVSDYLSRRIVEGYSAWTLQTERSALRLFFSNRQMAADVPLPKRKRENITRSRLPAQRDQHFQPENWRPLIDKGKGGKEREVPVLPGTEQQVLQLVEGRALDEHVFDRLPSNMDIHALRRQFAQERYTASSVHPLPEKEGRLSMAEVDHHAAKEVTQALGHERLGVLYTHYLR